MSHFYESLHPDDVPPWHQGEPWPEPEPEPEDVTDEDEGEPS